MIGQRLEVRQGQGLVITPQLQQAIKLLQLSNQELDAFVEAELERNPLLQRDEPEGDGAEAVETAPAETVEAADEAPAPKKSLARQVQFYQGQENVQSIESAAVTRASIRSTASDGNSPSATKVAPA